VTIAEAISAATRVLEAAGIEDARIEAELLLRHALGVDRAALYARLDEALPDNVAACHEALLGRRLDREPSAHILGEREFYGLAFKVTPDVLVPRPETELLVETAIELAKPRSRIRRGPIIADVGTGSGAITVALALNVPRSSLYAIDYSREALEVAEANAKAHGVADRVMCLRGDLLSPLPEYVDVIVANLPYVTTAELETLAPEVRDHEPRLALDGGADGLGLIRRLLDEAPRYLRPNGAVCIEIGAAQGTAAISAARAAFPDAAIELRRDFAGRDRVVVVRTA
jgi:release factor glutamine methyltransferase